MSSQAGASPRPAVDDTAALARERDRYADLVEHAPFGYVTLDGDGAVEEANRAAASILGADPDDLRGRRFADLVEPEAWGAFDAHRRAVLASGERQACELAVQRADGARRVLRLESAPVAGTRRCRTALIDLGVPRPAGPSSDVAARLERRLTGAGE